jgi:LmbE family N-acetylglucosaminyl deacetylase
MAAVTALGAAAPALYFVTLPRGAMEGVVAAASRRRGSEAGLWDLAPSAFGAGASPATFIVDVRDWAERKLDAIRCHRTQIASGHALAHVDVSDVRQWLGFEHFRRSAAGRTNGLLERLGNPAPSAEAAGSHAP